MSTETCSTCKIKTRDLFRTPFGKLICDECISKQFQTDETIHLPEMPLFSNTEDTNNFGIKLFRLKEDLNDFLSRMTNYESRIKNKFDLIRFEINQNLNFCSSEITKEKKLQLNQMDSFENDLILKFTSSKETDKFQILTNLYTKFTDYYTQLSSKLSSINNLNDANTDLAQVILTQLDDIEKQLVSFEKYISDQIVELNQTYFYRKYLNFTKRKTFKSLQFGSLNVCDENKLDDKKINFGPYLKKLMLKNEQNETVSNSVCFFVESIKTINEFDNEMIIIQSKMNENDYVLRMYGIKHGYFKSSIEFNQKKLFMFDSNAFNLILVHSNDLNEYNFELFDKDLKLLHNLKRSFDKLSLIDIFIDFDKIYLLLFDQTELDLWIVQLNLDLTEFNMLKVKHIQFNKTNSISESKFKLFTIENKIFLKQNHLFGTRLNFIDSSSGNCLSKFDLNFFLLDNNFIIDNNLKLIAFSMNDLKFLVYDLNCQKILYKISLNESKFFFNSICLTRDGSIISLMK